MYSIRKKLIIQSWENIVTDGQTDKSDFIERCLTNVKRPMETVEKGVKYDANDAVLV